MLKKRQENILSVAGYILRVVTTNDDDIQQWNLLYNVCN